MKRLLLTTLATIALFVANPIQAACTQETYIIDGKLIQCTKCCNDAGCQITCF